MLLLQAGAQEPQEPIPVPARGPLSFGTCLLISLYEPSRVSLQSSEGDYFTNTPQTYDESLKSVSQRLSKLKRTVDKLVAVRAA